MDPLHHRTCVLCEAMCGLELEVKDGKVTSIRGDRADPHSQGYLCPKALALKDIHEDPARLRRPRRRVGERWEELGWDQAFDLVAQGLHDVRRRHGADAVGYYQGNPHIHSYGATFGAVELGKALGTRSKFSTASMDHLPHLMAALQMFGHQLLMPVPDLDRTSMLLVVGANPAVSNGSVMSAPDMPRRLKAIRARGGRVVVVDPRRTRTAELADEHLAVVPGTDALLLLGMIRTLFEEGLVRLGRLEALVTGIQELAEAAAGFAPEVVAPRAGVPAEAIRRVARQLAEAPSAVCYGRVGACTQEFGGLTVWLLTALNVLTGNLDRPGGAMFTTPAADAVAIGTALGLKGSYGEHRSSVRGLPAFTGELPVAALAEELEAEGPSRIRGLLVVAGNPVLSTPGGGKLDRLLPGLDFLACVDFYLNETARHAHVVLPPTFALERDHYDLSMNLLSVRNVTRYTEPLFPPAEGARDDWQISLELAARLNRLRGPAGWPGFVRNKAGLALTARRVLDLTLRLGPYRGLSTRALAREAHTRDLGPLQPRLPRRLHTRDRKVQLAPPLFLQDLRRLAASLQAAPAAGLVLVGRRQLRTNNSWLHNLPRLVKGRTQCTLLMHPEDARSRGLADGQQVRLASKVGAVEVPLELTPDIRPGVVSLPHGFGHTRPGTEWPVASSVGGASLNDVTDPGRVDALTGTVAFSALPVTVEPVP